MIIHELKCWPEFFTPIVDGRKTFDIRKCDRAFSPGDQLFLREYDPYSKGYTGNEILVEVTYILFAIDFRGLEHGYCAMSIRIVDEPWLQEKEQEIEEFAYT
ncbi:MAG: DUF3850 domain-containing protein [Bacteroidota bacterium]